jgi:hypothetical protein
MIDKMPCEPSLIVAPSHMVCPMTSFSSHGGDFDAYFFVKSAIHMHMHLFVPNLKNTWVIFSDAYNPARPYIRY